MPIRTICIPVAEVITGGTKQEFYKDLRNSLDMARRAANICISHCAKEDTELMTGGKAPKFYTYPFVKDMFPGASFAPATIARAAEKHYKEHRFQVARGNRSLPIVRSHPWPLLHNESSKILRIEDAGEYLTASFVLLGGKWKVRIAGGSCHRDQLRGLRAAMARDKGIRDSKIWVDKSHKAILGISVDVPVKERAKPVDRCMKVVSGREEFLCCSFERSTVPFVITGDAACRKAAERDRRYQRLRQDRKSDRSIRKRINQDMDAISARFQSWMKTYMHQTTAAIVTKAVRMDCTQLELDLTIKSFCKAIPWFQLKQMLAYKCEKHDIRLIDTTVDVKEPDLSNPHVYFLFSPKMRQVKIGMTADLPGKRKRSNETAVGEPELTILAVDNQSRSKLRSREKFWHSYFNHCRIAGEWFGMDPVVSYLKESRLLGNAGNLAEIAQVLDLD